MVITQKRYKWWLTPCYKNEFPTKIPFHRWFATKITLFRRFPTKKTLCRSFLQFLGRAQTSPPKPCKATVIFTQVSLCDRIRRSISKIVASFHRFFHGVHQLLIGFHRFFYDVLRFSMVYKILPLQIFFWTRLKFINRLWQNIFSHISPFIDEFLTNFTLSRWSSHTIDRCFSTKIQHW